MALYYVMLTCFDAICDVFRHWHAFITGELEPLETCFPKNLPLGHRNSLVVTLSDDIIRPRETARLWFNPEDREHIPTATKSPLSSKIYRLELDCLIKIAASTVSRLSPAALEVLYLKTQDTPSLDAIASFLRATAECSKTTRLRELALSDHSLSPKCPRRAMGTPSRRPHHSGGMDPLDFSHHITFGPLLWKTWDLSTLTLEITDALEFTDAFVEHLADACPRLSYLSLCGPAVEKRMAPLDRPPRMSLISLKLLATKCPELSELCIEFDATRPMEIDDVEWKRGVSTELLELEVGMSPVAAPDRVAALIRSLLPGLFRLSWFDSDWSQDEFDDTELNRTLQWSKVEEILGLWSSRVGGDISDIGRLSNGVDA